MLITFLITCYICICSGHYTFVAPGTIRSNSDYHVSLSLDGYTQPAWFNITLELHNTDFAEVISSTTVEIGPKTTKLVKMQLPKLYYGHGLLKIIGYRGIICKEIARIGIEERQYTVYIQTNKAKYKPGEMMQFRVILIDRLTRPAKIDEHIDVHIYDGQKNLIKKFSDPMLVQGVFKGDLQLSDHVVLGEWVIEVTAGGVILEEMFFEVARYVLPKFSVEIDTKKNVAINEDKVAINVKSSYTYDQPVIGNLTIDLKPIYPITLRSTIAKEYEFDGETTTWFDFETDLEINKYSFKESNSELFSYMVTATVTEALTGLSYSATSQVKIHSSPYKVEVQAPQTFDADDFVNITVSVTDFQGHPIKDSTNPITIKVKSSGLDLSKLMSLISAFEDFDIGMPVEVESSVFLNENGVGAVTLKLPSEEIVSEYEVTANYRGYDFHTTKLKRNYVGIFNLEVLTKRPKVGEELLIMLRSTEPIDYFVYEIISRGDIIQSQRINVPDNKTTHLLRLNATYAMVPKITIFVHRIKDKLFTSHLKDVYIKQAFQNSINITTEEKVHPGTLVSVYVSTDESSYVGLMGIDESLLLFPDYKTSLTEDNIYTELRNYDSLNIDEELYPGSEAGLITFSNGLNRAGDVIGRPHITLAGVGGFRPATGPFDKPSIDIPRVRKLFAESWMFKDFERTPKQGLTLYEVIPDTITSWAVTGFSLNANTGLTLTRNITKLKVFQELFVSMDLPNMVKEGETIEIPVYVFNYLDQDLLTNVTITSFNIDLEILDSLSSDSGIQHNKTFSKSIPSKRKEKFVFLMRPRKSGSYNVKVKAISSIASNAVEKILSVEPEGVPYSISKTYLVHLLEDSNSQEREDDVLVGIPDNSIPNSETIYLSVVGDIFAPLMRSLENLVRVPFGNSENNMKYFVSNLLVLKYLKAMNHSKPSLEKKAKLYLELGYQTQLTFSHLDGSFSLFDKTVERTGDTRLTAYTMWALNQAKDYIQIDSEVIKRGLRYLKSQQSEIGGFSSGKNVDEDASLTAFSILAFLVEDKSQSQYQDVINKGLQYLYNVLADIEQATAIAVSTYALVLGKHNKSEELLANVGTQAVLKSKQLQWTKSDTLQSNIEITTYTFLSLLESHETSVETLYPILKSLISIEQAKATPAYLLALEAMTKFAQHISFDTTDCSIHFEDGQGESGDLFVNSSNAQVLQQVQLRSTSRRIKLRTKGKGFALVSINYKYNIVPENHSSSHYQTNVTITEPSDRDLVLDVCVSKQLNGTQSNLTVVEVNLQSGYTVYEYGFNRIKDENERVKSIELMKSGQSVRVFLENISQNGTCIRLGATKAITIFNPKPNSIVVHDIENEDQRSVLYYQVNPRRMN